MTAPILYPFCQNPDCNRLSSVECHDDSGEVILYCEIHADATGHCTYCGERRDDRNPDSGLCFDCIQEGIAE